MVKNSSQHYFITSVRISNISFHQNWPTGTETTYKIIYAPMCQNIYLYIRQRYSCCCTYHEGICRGGSSVPLILSLDTKWTWVVNFTTWLLYLWQKAPDPLNKGMGELCNWVRHFGQKINLLALLGIKQFLGQSSCSLCYPGFHVITCKKKLTMHHHISLSHIQPHSNHPKNLVKTQNFTVWPNVHTSLSFANSVENFKY